MPTLFLLLIVVPLLELYLLVHLAGEIGFWPTVGITVATAILGTHLARSEGRRAWTQWNESLAALQSPTQSVIEGLMILVGGTLLLTPGLITDAVGFALLIPWTRRALLRPIKKRIDRYVENVRVSQVGVHQGRNFPESGFFYRRPGGPDVVDTTSEPVEEDGKRQLPSGRPGEEGRNS